MQAVTTFEFVRQVVAQKANAIVEVGEDWSSTSQVMRHTVTAVAQNHKHGVALYHINSDESPQLLHMYHLEALPAVLFFRQGVLVDKLLGLTSKHCLEIKLSEHFNLKHIPHGC
jgi:thioredoxin 1